MLTLTSLSTIKGQSRGTIKYTQSDYVIKRKYKWAPSSEGINGNSLASQRHRLIGIPGHVLGVREVRGSKPGGTINLLCPNLAGERQETKKC